MDIKGSIMMNEVMDIKENIVMNKIMDIKRNMMMNGHEKNDDNHD